MVAVKRLKPELIKKTGDLEVGKGAHASSVAACGEMSALSDPTLPLLYPCLTPLMTPLMTMFIITFIMMVMVMVMMMVMILLWQAMKMEIAVLRKLKHR